MPLKEPQVIWRLEELSCARNSSCKANHTSPSGDMVGAVVFLVV